MMVLSLYYRFVARNTRYLDVAEVLRACSGDVAQMLRNVAQNNCYTPQQPLQP